MIQSACFSIRVVKCKPQGRPERQDGVFNFLFKHLLALFPYPSLYFGLYQQVVGHFWRQSAAYPKTPEKCKEFAPSFIFRICADNCARQAILRVEVP